MRRYVPVWQSAGISKDRYIELLHYCRQYPEWLSEANSMLGTHAVNLDGMPHGTGVSDPVAAVAEKRSGLLYDIQLVEKCAAGAGEGWYTAVMQNVCMGKKYYEIDPILMPTSNRNAFFAARKKFFILLDRMKRREGQAG